MPGYGAGNRARILVVEDFRLTADKIKVFLQLDDYEVESYWDGGSAQRVVEGGKKFNLAVIDRELPVVSGDELIPYFKKLHPSMPIISISAYDPNVPGADFALDKKGEESMFYGTLRECVKRLIRT
jgi:CheY-like chemotaxis protein